MPNQCYELLSRDQLVYSVGLGLDLDQPHVRSHAILRVHNTLQLSIAGTYYHQISHWQQLHMPASVIDPTMMS